uniref:ATPase 8 n=1 Tax=Xerotyphlops socotranus TaxID=1316654 RepID=A0A286S0U7_9SAUR|nr:ATPase 8 [Xerotyphlops socotranus]
MPQLSKTNLFMMFLCTWLSLRLIASSTKKLSVSSSPTYDTMMLCPEPWYWPYI